MKCLESLVVYMLSGVLNVLCVNTFYYCHVANMLLQQIRFYFERCVRKCLFILV